MGEVRRITVDALAARIGQLAEPVIVTDLARRWRAHERWSHDHLKRALDLDDVGVGAALPASLAADVEFPDFTRLSQQVNVWLARHGQVSELHFDLPHNLNTVIRGEKEFILFHPRESKNLYPYAPWSRFGALNSRVRLDEIDDAFPRAHLARYWRVVVREGETIYVPPFFWHHVRSRGESVAVNIWFHTEPSKLRRTSTWPPEAIATAILNRLRKLLRSQK